MKISTSYFYQIRNFKSNMIPLSTAMWDPKWFKGISLLKNNVIKGLKAECFVPGKKCEGLCSGPSTCTTDCKGYCKFIDKYKSQLFEYDINDILSYFEELAEYARSINNFEGEPHIVLIVFETPDNPCSERKSIQEYFKENGIECSELEYPIK